MTRVHSRMLFELIFIGFIAMFEKKHRLNYVDVCALKCLNYKKKYQQQLVCVLTSIVQGMGMLFWFVGFSVYVILGF